LACVLGLGLAAPAYADTASDLAAARTKLEQIGTQTQQIYDELATQTQALDQTAGEITQKQQEIADGQAKLSTYVAGEYKTGGLSLLQVLTGVDDLSDMLNRLFYYGKVSDKQAQTIQEVKELKQQLTDKQAEQEKNVADTQKKVDELNAQQAEAQRRELPGFAAAGRACRRSRGRMPRCRPASTHATPPRRPRLTTRLPVRPRKTMATRVAARTSPLPLHAAVAPLGSRSGSTPQPPSPSVEGGFLLYRAPTANSVLRVFPGRHWTRTALTAGFVSYCLTGRCAAWALPAPLWAGPVCPIRSRAMSWSTRTTGIYIGNGQMIHASDYNTGVIISSVATGMNNNYIFVRY
ncbi:MAG: hypothetical protein ACLS3M_09800, partial [Collinsella sp.]